MREGLGANKSTKNIMNRFGEGKMISPLREDLPKDDFFQLSDQEYLLEFKKRVEGLRVPLTGSLAITHRCNLRCVHCYLGSEKSDSESIGRELDTSRVLSIINQIAQAGCLFLLITGGEPLLRDDFVDIYRYARTRGLFVTVFTNGTLIADRIFDVFEEYPPLTVEISLYGATAKTYERVTGEEGSYQKCLQGIEKLAKRKVNLTLKTVLMTLNHHEFFEMQDMARRYGARFRIDGEIFPRFNGEKSPIQLRIPCEEVVEKEFSDKQRFLGYKALYKRFEEIPAAETLYSCGAGVTHFHVDPSGMLQPCLMVRSLRYNLSKGDFLTGWREVMPQIRNKRAESSYGCNRCEKRILCGVCPAFFELESESEVLQSDYLCSIGQLRYEALQREMTNER